jgi:hypothetical protein
MGLAAKSNVELAVLCDPDMTILQERAGEFEKKYGKKIAIEAGLSERLTRIKPSMLSR